LLHVGEDVIKGINNLKGVFSGETRYNWWSELVKDPVTLYNIKLLGILMIVKQQ
jgi:hypothetical protein